MSNSTSPDRHRLFVVLASAAARPNSPGNKRLGKKDMVSSHAAKWNHAISIERSKIMSEDYRSMWVDLGLDLEAHDALLGVPGTAYEDI